MLTSERKQNIELSDIPEVERWLQAFNNVCYTLGSILLCALTILHFIYARAFSKKHAKNSRRLARCRMSDG